MQLTILKFINRLSNTEKIIGILSLIAGIILTYDSIYLIYAYHFTGILFMFMTPITTLVVNLMIGIFLISSSLFSLKNNKKSSLIYKFSGIFLIIYPFNINFIDFIKNDWFDSSLYIFIIIPFGLLLLLYYNRNKFKENEKVNIFNRLDKLKYIICFLLYVFIDIIFINWSYHLDRIM